MSNPTAPQSSELEQILTKLVAKMNSLQIDDMPDNVGILMPSLDIQEAKAAIDKLIREARLHERKQVALDNYQGQTFSEATNYKGKFDKFVRNNERRLSELKKGEIE